MSVIDREITKENILERLDALEEAMIQLEAHALTSQNILADKVGIGNIAIDGLGVGDLALTSKIYNNQLGSLIIASAFMSLPFLRGLWNLGAQRDSSPHYGSIEGNTLDLTNVGIQSHVVDNQISCGNFGVGGTDRAYASDGGNWDIQGNETYVPTAYRGLTMGAWVRFSAASWATANVIGKWTYTGNQRSYNLRFDSNGKPIIYISTDGTAVVSEPSDMAADLATWVFVAGRFKPSISIKVYHGVKGVMYETTETSGIPATLFNGTSQFEIGSYNGGGAYWQGQIAWPFLCFGALPDLYINRVYEITKWAFGHD